MTEIDRFDPFNNRLCRDVRNAMTESFTSVLVALDIRPARHVAENLLNAVPPATIRTYIERRIAAYEQVLADIIGQRLEHPLAVVVAIWDRQLFFEMHAVLEHYWMKADGDQKRLFQAMIRAAGTYVHLEQGNLAGAKRIAGKAVEGLERFGDHLSAYADPRLLLEKLKNLDPVPPLLTGTGHRATAV